MKEVSTIADHLNEFNTLISKLVSINVKIENEDRVITLLCFLPNI